MSSKSCDSRDSAEQTLSDEQQAKIKEIRKTLGPLPEKLARYCSDASIARYLTARSWNVKKATKMLKESLKWRLQYKPEEILWEEIAKEAETGKIYRTNYYDKCGRSILVMRPGCQNTKSTAGQIRYLVYCMENAILNLPADQDQMVWLIDFHGFNLGNLSIKVTKETAHVLQEHYPERLGIAILYNPPKFFEPFWELAKPFLEPKTRNKVKFVYSDKEATMQTMVDLFNMDELESAFGGNGQVVFNIDDYGKMMKEDDKRMPQFQNRGSPSTSSEDTKPSLAPNACLNSGNSESDSKEADHSLKENPSSPRMHDSKCSRDETSSVEANGNGNGKSDVGESEERWIRSSDVNL